MGTKPYWTRKELKTRAKQTLRLDYWRMVLVSVIMMFLAGIGQTVLNTNGFSFEDFKDMILDNIDVGLQIKNFQYIVGFIGNHRIGSIFFAFSVIMGVLFIVLSSLSINVITQVFVFNPLKVGVCRYYNKSMVEKTESKTIMTFYDHHYKNVIKIMFVRDLKTFLWSLLFIIPGVVKYYEYCMVPYILSDNPELDTNQVLTISSELMRGQKWKTFVLDLSFIGWLVLCGITLGALCIFYVAPYSNLTHAALYRKLRGLDDTPDNIFFEGMSNQEYSDINEWRKQ